MAMHNEPRSLVSRLYSAVIDLLLIAIALYVAAELIRAVWVVLAIVVLVLAVAFGLLAWYRSRW